MTQKTFTIVRKRFLDKALYNLLLANSNESVLTSFKLNAKTTLDIRAYKTVNYSCISLLFTFNLKAYETEAELRKELELYSSLNPTTSFEVFTRFFAYLENDKMSVYELDENQNVINKIIKSWQNLKKSQSELAEVASASKSVS